MDAASYDMSDLLGMVSRDLRQPLDIREVISRVVDGSRFEEFKAGIKHLIVQEFFTREHIERFFQSNDAASAEGITARIDFDRVFEHLTDAITESPMGGMLNMMGGRQALAPLKAPRARPIPAAIASGFPERVPAW